MSCTACASVNAWVGEKTPWIALKWTLSPKAGFGLYVHGSTRSCTVTIEDPDLVEASGVKEVTLTVEPVDSRYCAFLCRCSQSRVIAVDCGDGPPPPPPPPFGPGDDGDDTGGCTSGSCLKKTSGSGSASNGSIDVRLALGEGSDGHSAGSIRLVEESPRADLVSVDSFQIIAQPEVTVEDVYNGDPPVFVMRRVVAPTCEVEIEATFSDTVEVRFYAPADLDDPFRTWTFEDLDPSPTPGSHVQVTDSGSDAVHEYTYVGTSGVTWELAQKDSSEALLRTITRTDDGGAQTRTKTLVYKDASDEMLYKVATQYDEENDSRVMARRVYDSTTTYLETAFTYDENDRVESVSRPDGSWVLYTYDGEDRVATKTTPWLDVTLAEVAGSQNPEDEARTLAYSYTPPTGSPETTVEFFENRPRVITESIEGDVVSKTYFAYESDGEVLTTTEVRVKDPVNSTAWNAAGNLTTTTETYEFTFPENSQLETYLAGRPKSVVYPDNRKVTYAHAKGTYTPSGSGDSPGTFVEDDGPDLRTIVTHGTTSYPAGIEDKSTQEVAITDAAGHALLAETYVYHSSAYERIGWAVNTYDAFGRRTHTYRNNNTQTEAVWSSCCGLSSKTDETGTEITYNTYHPLGWVEEWTKKGVSGEQVDVTTSVEQDGLEWTTTTTATVGEETLSRETSRTSDLAGRVVSTVDASGLETTYLYETAGGGGRKVTVTRPGNATEITEYDRDGRIKSVTGTGVVAQYYSYGTNNDGSQWTTVLTGSDSEALTPFQTTTTTDPLGRTIEVAEVTSTASGAPEVVTTHHYNNLGQLEKTEKNTVVNSTPTQILADMRYTYDGLGNVEYSGLDVDDDGLEYANSDDRVTKTETKYEKDGSDHWWTVTTTTRYDDADNAIITKSKRRLTGFGSGETAESVSVDARNNATTSMTAIDRTAKTVTSSVDYPDSGTDAVSVTLNGLLQSSTSKTGVTTTFGYDGLGRRTAVQEARKAYPTITEYDDNTGRVSKTRVQTGESTYLDTVYTYDNAGRTESITNPESETQYFSYTPRGELERTWGSAVYPVMYAFDAFGRRTEIRTYQSGSAWGQSTWPASPGEADVTTFHFGETGSLSRWLTEKEYADATSVTYTRSPDGKLETRTWARQVGPNEDEALITGYVYDDDTGELAEVKYYHDTEQTPDPDTHGIVYTYTRLGQHHTVEDIVGTRTFGYNAYGELASETIDAGANGLYSRTITRDYENGTGETVAGRNAGFHIDTEYVVTYAYEPKTTGTGRLNRINGPGLPGSGGGAFYGYTADSDLVGTLTYKDTSGTAVASATRVYDDHRDLLEYVENKAGSGLPVVSKYLYASDGAGRRTSVVYTGSAFDAGHHVDFGYNDRGELTSADRRQGTTPGTGDSLAADKHAFAFTYDPIGNRESYQLDGGTATTYTANDVNQYTATADPTEYFCYDADGNLVADGKPTSNCETADGTMTYVWNAENRLIEAYPTTPATNDKKVQFKYDYLGRRVEKVVLTYSGSAWSVQSTQRFVYEGPALDTPGTGGSQGWNVALVLNGAGTTQQKYTWGLDLSGAMQGAGGIGGLLAVDEVDGTYAGESYWFFYDGNGNVGQLLNADDQTLAAHYEYDPYGNVIAASDEDSSDYVNANPIRFSTKWFDAETELYSYTYRDYSPCLGRWASRDPAAEEEGPNLLAFVRNSPLLFVDPLGRQLYPGGGSAWIPDPTPPAKEEWGVCGCRVCRRWGGFIEHNGNRNLVGHTWIECNDGLSLDFPIDRHISLHHNAVTTCDPIRLARGGTIWMDPNLAGPRLPTKCASCDQIKDCLRHAFERIHAEYDLQLIPRECDKINCVGAKSKALAECGLSGGLHLAD